jgi:hypothetical protein
LHYINFIKHGRIITDEMKVYNYTATTRKNMRGSEGHHSTGRGTATHPARMST